MNSQIKDEWVAALRSGRFKQTFEGYLRKKNGFCCLGVLAQIMGAKWNELKDNTYYMCDEFGYREQAYLTDFFAKEAGLSSRTQRMLAEMNDEHKTFKYIADWIDDNL